MISPKTAADFTKIVADSVDADPTISVRDLGARFLLRLRLFIACVCFVTLVVLGLNALISPVYKSTAQVLVKRGLGNAAYFQGVVSDKTPLSGNSVSEMIRSNPVCRQMIQEVGVEKTDIALPIYRQLLRYPMTVVSWFIKEEGYASPEQEISGMAKELKDSIKTKILQSDATSARLNSEDVVEITLKSTNRTKVAEMVNGLCESFIDQVCRANAAEAKSAVTLLEVEIKRTREEMVLLRRSMGESVKDTGDEDLTVQLEGGVGLGELSEPTSPSATLAKEAATLQLKLFQLRALYKEDSSEIVRASSELETARKALFRQQGLESLQVNLSQLKKRKQQAAVAAAFYENGLSSVSIIEEGLTPSTGRALRWGIPLAGGLGLGIFLGLGLVLVLSLTDEKIFLVCDAEAASGMSVTAQLPISSQGRPRTLLSKKVSPSLSSIRLALFQTIHRLDCGGEDVRSVIIAGADRSEGKTFLALQLASALAQEKRDRILLVDAHLENPELTRSLGLSSADGLSTLLRESHSARGYIVVNHLSHLDVLPAGKVALVDEMGYLRQNLKGLLAELRNEGYRAIIIDGGEILQSRLTQGLIGLTDGVLVMTRGGVTKRANLKRSMAFLEESGARTFGVIFNAIPYLVGWEREKELYRRFEFWVVAQVTKYRQRIASKNSREL